ncbi:MAG: HAD family phosphatase [Lachnospiraceae bacterium]|nr:HAD family phosphatase [Lachnospiraceae bacterium]
MKGCECSAVVFDMDGVIFDSERLVMESWLTLAERDGYGDMKGVLYRCLGVNAVETKEIFLEHYGREFPYEAYRKEASRWFHERFDGGRLPLKPGVRELLAALQKAGIGAALASSTREAVVRQELGDAGLLPYFSGLICGDMVKRSKPAPDIYLAACELLDVPPEQAVAIEDSFNGIRSAHAAGLRPIMVPDLLPPDDEMRRLSYRIFGDLTEVRRWLLKEEKERGEERQCEEATER